MLLSFQSLTARANLAVGWPDCWISLEFLCAPTLERWRVAPPTKSSEMICKAKATVYKNVMYNDDGLRVYVETSTGSNFILALIFTLELKILLYALESNI